MTLQLVKKRKFHKMEEIDWMKVTGNEKGKRGKGKGWVMSRGESDGARRIKINKSNKVRNG